jgi:C4-dicarboxylate-specific signal transduction histidine kinase
LFPLFLYALLPVLFWVAIRFEPFFLNISFLMFAFLAAGSTLRGCGPLLESSCNGDVLSLQFLSSQLFLIGIAISLLLLSAAMQELRRSQNLLRRQEEKPRPDGIDPQKYVELATELAHANEQLTHLARVKLLGELSGAFAHEINQPLLSILANAQAARRFMNSPSVDLNEIRDILDDIVQEGRHAAGVIHHLRALFKKSEAQMQPLEVNELVRDTLALARSRLVACAVQPTQHSSPHSCMVRGNRVQLQQVLLNLIVNACEAMNARPAQTRLLTLSIADDDRNGNVRISVTDTGPGITPDAIGKVFDTFFTTKAHGMGVGLSVTRTIILEHGGCIEADNHCGGGAIFRIALPVYTGALS